MPIAARFALAAWIATAGAAMAAPTEEAQALGKRLAAAGTLATIAPLLIERDVADLAKEATTLTPTETARLKAIGQAEGRKGIDRLTAAMGAAYAERLSVDELRTLVAQAESPAAAKRRAIEPAVLMAAMQSAGEIDVKKDVAAAFCKETGKLCKR